MGTQPRLDLETEATIAPIRLFLGWPVSDNDYYVIDARPFGVRVKDRKTGLMVPKMVKGKDGVERQQMARGGRKVRSKEGREYEKHVAEQVLCQVRGPRLGKRRVSIIVTFYEPQIRRGRDVCNYWKCLNDCLESAGLFDNDKQIDVALAKRASEPSALPGGHVVVTVSEYLG